MFIRHFCSGVHLSFLICFDLNILLEDYILNILDGNSDRENWLRPQHNDNRSIQQPHARNIYLRQNHYSASSTHHNSYNIKDYAIINQTISSVTLDTAVEAPNAMCAHCQFGELWLACYFGYSVAEFVAIYLWFWRTMTTLD